MNKLANIIVPDKSLHIFDLGNVLYRVDAGRSLAALEKLGLEHVERQISNSHAAGGAFSLYCDGKITTAQFFDGVRQMCGIGATDAQIAEAWNAMLLGFEADSLRTVRDVRSQGARVALLSNCNELHTELVRKQHKEMFDTEFDSLFDEVFFSQEIGMSKPNPETWKLVLRQMGADAADAAFYDDSQLNIDKAAELGIESRLFCL